MKLHVPAETVSGNGNEEADVANGDDEMPDNEDTVEEGQHLFFKN